MSAARRHYHIEPAPRTREGRRYYQVVDQFGKRSVPMSLKVARARLEWLGAMADAERAQLGEDRDA